MVRHMENQNQPAKSAHVTFTTKRALCPPVTMNNVPIPMQSDKYLGLHLDQRLTWRTHIKTKRHHLNLKLRGMYWLLGRRSKLSLENKLLLFKCVLKPVWMYGIHLWGCAKPSHIQIIQRLQSKILRSIIYAPCTFPTTHYTMTCTFPLSLRRSAGYPSSTTNGWQAITTPSSLR